MNGIQKDHTKIDDEKTERGKNWDKHTSKRPGSDEKKKNENRGWFRRKPPKKKKDQNK